VTRTFLVLGIHDQRGVDRGVGWWMAFSTVGNESIYDKSGRASPVSFRESRFLATAISEESRAMRASNETPDELGQCEQSQAIAGR